MDAREQAEGERRVKAELIEPLQRLGLGKPSTLTRAQFDVMTGELCQMLAYMSAANLQALAEVVAANPGGKDRDRFPIANKILDWARQMQEPPGDGSPLQRAVFASALGRQALDELWAPELLRQLREDRKWPGPWLVSQVKQRADEARRRLVDIEARLARGDQVSQEEAQWRSQRRAALQRCQDIRNRALEGAGA